MQRLPRIYANPATLRYRQLAHIQAVLCFDQTRLFVSIADTGEVGADYFELGVEAGVVGGHFEHAQVEESDGAEGATCYEDEGSAIAALDAAAEAGGGEFVVCVGGSVLRKAEGAM